MDKYTKLARRRLKRLVRIIKANGISPQELENVFAYLKGKAEVRMYTRKELREIEKTRRL
jgi:hypothetical protein